MSTAQSIFIVDSEAEGRSQLRQTLDGLRSVFPHQIVGEADSARSALAQIGSLRPSVLLVNPALPDMNGIEFGRQLAVRAAGATRQIRWPEPERGTPDADQPMGRAAPQLIYVSRSDRHALDAFEVSALDYLLKPVNPARLLKALNRAVPDGVSNGGLNEVPNAVSNGAAAAPGARAELSGLALAGPLAYPLLSAPAAAPARAPARRHFAVHERGRLMLVPVEQVVYLKAELKYVTVRTRQREYLIEDSLTALEAEFGDRFVRIHRNALVCRAAISGFERVPADGQGVGSEPHWQVVLRDVSERLPVSRRQWSTVRNLMG
ncbi:MAG: LytR/AlgR family response regulator transcription factor [Burkholderiaceae bacterium]|jgi:two-component system response regulator AlgR